MVWITAICDDETFLRGRINGAGVDKGLFWCSGETQEGVMISEKTLLASHFTPLMISKLNEKGEIHFVLGCMGTKRVRAQVISNAVWAVLDDGKLDIEHLTLGRALDPQQKLGVILSVREQKKAD